MRVLVTGGSGGVGRYTVDEFAKYHEVTSMDMTPPKAEGNFRFVQGNVLSWDEMTEKVVDQDVVVHLAGITGNFQERMDDTFLVNVQGTFNVIDACRRNGIPHFIFTSSDSAYGLVFHQREWIPQFLPLDETHPILPGDPYGMTKLIGEEICKGFNRRCGMKTTSIRPSWVWLEEERHVHRQVNVDPGDWWQGMWAYVDSRDCAQAFRLAAESKEHWDFEAFLIGADDTGVDIPSRELAAKYFPTVTNLPEDFGGFETFYSNKKAKRMLGYQPQHSWREFLK